MYPTSAEIGGKIYPINTNLATARECFGIINDPGISDYERSLAVIYKLFGFIPETDGGLFLEKARIFLQRGEPADGGAENPDMDILADEGYIIASFRMDYGVDLNAENMHFWQFLDLLQGLSENCVLSRVRKIRNYNLSEISDPAERAKMAAAQEALKLPERLSAEEKQAVDEFEALFE